MRFWSFQFVKTKVMDQLDIVFAVIGSILAVLILVLFITKEKKDDN